MQIRLIDYDNPNSMVSRFRLKRMKILMSFVESVATKGKCFRILDIGGAYVYWQSVPSEFFERFNIQIVLLNLTAPPLPSGSTRFISLSGDACNLENFSDSQFDLVHSNSVIEHVGSWQNMQRMSKEMDRVGRAIYIQTPYFWFPVEPHFVTPFLHWFPLSIRCKLAMLMSMGNWPKAKSLDEAVRAQQSSTLLDLDMMRELFPGAVFQFERFIGLPKSIIAIKHEKVEK